MNDLAVTSIQTRNKLLQHTGYANHKKTNRFTVHNRPPLIRLFRSAEVSIIYQLDCNKIAEDGGSATTLTSPSNYQSSVVQIKVSTGSDAFIKLSITNCIPFCDANQAVMKSRCCWIPERSLDSWHASR